MSSKLIIVCIILGMATLVTGSQNSDQEIATLKRENMQLKKKVTQLEKKIKDLESELRVSKGVKRVSVIGKNIIQVASMIPAKYKKESTKLMEVEKGLWVEENLVGKSTFAYATIKKIDVKSKRGKTIITMDCVIKAATRSRKTSITATIKLHESQISKVLSFKVGQKIKISGEIDVVNINGLSFHAVLIEASASRL